MIAFVLALALAAPNPASIDAPRNAFRACLKTFETNQMKAKVAADAYSTAVKSACPTEAQALDRRAGQVRRRNGHQAGQLRVANAERDVDDYRLTSEERYRDMASPQ